MHTSKMNGENSELLKYCCKTQVFAKTAKVNYPTASLALPTYNPQGVKDSKTSI